jgi:hypothetical protein
MRIYLDMCCLNRPFDDQGQDRIRLEAEAVLIVLAAVERGEHEIVSGEALELENDRNPDPTRRERVRDLLSLARVEQPVGTDEAARANSLAAMGFGAYDALHIACAEAASADVLLSTDRKLVGRAERLREHLRVSVRNPVLWVEEK